MEVNLEEGWRISDGGVDLLFSRGDED